MSSIAHPTPAMWNCCKAAPAGVISFTDGATIACKPCLGTVAPDRRHPLPPTPGTTAADAELRLKNLTAAYYTGSEAMTHEQYQARYNAIRAAAGF